MITIIKMRLAFCLCIILLIQNINTFAEDLNLNLIQVKNWASKFGNEIQIGSSRATCFENIEENYNRMGAKPVSRDPQKIMEEMVTDIENMFQWKMESVRRIAERAEELAANHTFDSNLPFEFYNAKKIYDENNEMEKYRIDNLPDKDRRQFKGLDLSSSPLLDGLNVSYDESAVHIPVNVYEETPTLKKQIKWSISLKDVFRNNRVVDPELNWQYFCSSYGFMRLYPATPWRIPDFLKEQDNERKPLDLYDCRLRNWFIKAAASSKDIVILLDGSGSMLGQRKEIARNVVINILDTLTDDDYVTVLRFSDVIEPVVSCFGESLVEANPQNLKTIRDQLTLLNTTDIANFTLALRTAFQILKDSKNQKSSSNCNQAIMLITDGASDNDRLDHNAVFEEFNYPRIDIRVFSYLVGKEVTDTKEVNWMACKNKGYYTHVANLAEIREQVQLYIPVMSRPLVLHRERVFAFTGTYSDVMDVPLNNWVWDAREREKIRQSIRRRIRETALLTKKEKSDYVETKDSYYTEDGNEVVSESYDENTSSDRAIDDKNQKNNEENEDKDSKDQLTGTEKDNYYKNNDLSVDINMSPKFERWVQNTKDDYSYGQEKPLDGDEMTDIEYNKVDSVEELKVPRKKGLHDLMMTISVPVFDTKNTTNTSEKYLEKNVWKQRFIEVRSANLLGVAGVDVPLREIYRLTPAYRLGVNAYPFIINNNGHVLFHPDLRPLFQDLIKPYYGSVDLTEVEFEDNDSEPRAPTTFDHFRSNMINRLVAWKTIPVKLHLDQMKRVITRNQTYCTAPIKNTPFSLAVAVPELYGKYSIHGQIEFKRKDEDYKKYFEGNKWTVHPDWVYCDVDLASKYSKDISAPQKRVLMFLEKANLSNIRWKSPSLSPQVYEELTCNKDLVQSLIFDAKATDINRSVCGQPNDLSVFEKDIADKFGINLTFVATRSGLTRYEDHYSKNWNSYEPEVEEEQFDNQNEINYDPINDSENSEDNKNTSFQQNHNKAIDEVFYKRAVDFYYIDPNAFVYSVPFNAFRRPESLVRITGSKAVFIGTGSKKAPAAVVGLQIQLNQFSNRFFNATKKCSGMNCENICSRQNSSLNCFLIDNNGYVIVSSVSHDHVGRFFGEIDYYLFRAFLDMNIFRAVRMYDFQAICIELINKISIGGSSSNLSNLFISIFNIQKFILKFVFDLLLMTFDFLSDIRTANAYSQSDQDSEDMNYNPSMFKGMVKDVKGKLLPPNRTKPFTCDKEFFLYEINAATRQELINNPVKKEYQKCEEACHQSFIISAVEKTNLLLVVYKDTCKETCQSLKRQIIPKTIIYGEACAIEKHHVGRERRRLPKCINYSPMEEEIKQCGKGFNISPNNYILLFFILFFLHKTLNFKILKQAHINHF